MALTNNPGRTPLGATYRSRLGVFRRVKNRGALIMAFFSTVREEKADDSYPFYEPGKTFTEICDIISPNGIMGDDTAVVLVGVKRSGATNNESGSSYTTGIDMLKPSGSSWPDHIKTAEFEINEPIGDPVGTRLRLEDFKEWFELGTDYLEAIPEKVYLLFQNDSSIYSGDATDDNPCSANAFYNSITYDFGKSGCDLDYSTSSDNKHIFDGGGYYGDDLRNFMDYLNTLGIYDSDIYSPDDLYWHDGGYFGVSVFYEWATTSHTQISDWNWDPVLTIDNGLIEGDRDCFYDWWSRYDCVVSSVVTLDNGDEFNATGYVDDRTLTTDYGGAPYINYPADKWESEVRDGEETIYALQVEYYADDWYMPGWLAYRTHHNWYDIISCALLHYHYHF